MAVPGGLACNGMKEPPGHSSLTAHIKRHKNASVLMCPRSVPLLLICFDVNVIKFPTPGKKEDTQAMPNLTVDIEDQENN